MRALRKWLGLGSGVGGQAQIGSQLVAEAFTPVASMPPEAVPKITIITIVQAQIAQFQRDYGVAPRRIELGAMEMAAVRRLLQKARSTRNPPPEDVALTQLMGLRVVVAKRASMIGLS